MYQKLSEEKRNDLLEAGIIEFADRGYERASLGAIAKRAHMSVGVIYKYYDDKEAFFLACVRSCLEELSDVIGAVTAGTDSLENGIRTLIRTLITHAKNHKEINRMYHEITTREAGGLSAMLAGEVESMAATAYTELLKKAIDEGKCREDADPRLFAFFFDNLFMMVQFSYCCEYYRERLKLYCGEDIFEDEDLVADQLARFIFGALGLRRELI